MPIKYAHPDPVVQNFWPVGPQKNPDWMETAPIEEQIYILWMVRLANAAELAGKSLSDRRPSPSTAHSERRGSRH